MSGVTYSDDPALLDLDRVHRWLASSYWSPGIERELVERAVAGSHCLGAYREGVQLGFSRAITDHATFAWLSDVFVDEAARGEGIGRGMVRWFVNHPRFGGIRRMGLVTLDAHGVYAELGFHRPLKPENFMERLAGDYARLLNGQP